MDKYEFNLKVEQMKKLAAEGDHTTAMKIADGIDWRRVPNVSLLTLVSEIYEKNGENDEAREILLLAYDRAPMGRGLLFRLAELSLATGKVQEAEKCFREFQDLAPKDPRLSLLRYEILKAKGVPAAQLIEPLERYNASEMDEKWMYELAEVYHKAGRHEECVNLCDRITLLFGTGTYVEKAMMLKTEGENVPLSDYQRSLIDNRDQHLARLKEVQEEYRKQDAALWKPQEVPAEPAAEGNLQYAADAVGNPDEAEAQPAADRSDVSGGVQIPDFVPQGPMEAVDDGAVPEVQNEIDAEIEAHLAKIDAERRQIQNEKRQNLAAEAVVRAREKAAAGAAAQAVAAAGPEPVQEKAAAAAEPEQMTSEAEEPAVEPEQRETAAAAGLEPEQMTPEAEEPAAEPEQAAPEAEEPAAESEAVETAVAAEPREEELTAAKPEETAVTGKAEKTEQESPKEEAVDDITRVLPRIRTEKTGGAGDRAPEESALGETKILPDIKSGRESAQQKAEPRKNASGAAPAEQKAAGGTAGKQAPPEEAESGQISKRPGDSSCFIEGKTAEEGLAAAISRLKAIHAATGIGNSAAKIRADRLNVRGVAASAEKISGKDLIIEEAGDLSDQSIKELLDLIHADEGRRTILLVDNPLQLTRLAKRNADFTAAFHAESFAVNAEKVPQQGAAKTAAREPAGKSGREIPAAAPSQKGPASAGNLTPEQTYAEEELDIDAFAHYASDYAKKIDCVITGKSMLALYERIEIMQDDGVKLTRKNAEALIEEVADRAEKPPLLKRIGGIFSPKYDKDGMLILKEEDF